MAFESVNPATQQKLKQYELFSPEEVKAALVALHGGFLSWRLRSFEERGKYVKRLSKALKDKAGSYAKLMASEMGKPVSQGIKEIEKCALACDYYVDNAEKFLSIQEIKTDASKSYAAFEPLGIVFAIMPWNFPFWQVFRFLAPALMGGNVGVLKHAQNVTGCALAIEEVVKIAAFPDEIFRTLIIDSEGAADVIENPLVKAVTLTGSTRAGKAVAAKAGSQLKKVVLELGGSDPYLILEDADLKEAIDSCVASRLINNGQSCIAAKRFIVHQRLKSEFEHLMVEKMKAMAFGDPFLKETELGPMARIDLRDELHQQVEKSIAKGAKRLLGGEIPDGKGAFYPPTILTDVQKGMPAYDEELFGPVASIISVNSEEEAIAAANDSVFGLGAAVFSKNKQRAELIAKEKLEAGACFVNAFVRSDPRLPFGGIKESGYGRELSSFGIHEFMNIKSVYVA